MSKNLDHLNEIDASDNEDFESDGKYPGEWEFYQTLKTVDDFVAPRLPETDEDESVNNQNTIEETLLPNDKDAQTMAFIRLVSMILTKKSNQNTSTDTKNEERNSEEPLITSTMAKTANDEATTESSTDETTTEIYVSKTFKRPTTPRTTQDVLNAFKAMHLWHFG